MALFRRDYAAAGDRYYQKGQLNKAVELYAKAGHYDQAAKLAQQLQDDEKAVELYVKAAAPLKAGELLASKGRHKDAIPYFEKAGAFWQAAESSLKLQQKLQAARLFEKAGALDKAAECHENNGELQEALRLWKAESDRLLKLSESDPGAKARRQAVDRRRSRMMVKAGQHGAAAEILAGLGLDGEAARLQEQSENFEEAAAAYWKAGEWKQALRLLPQAPGLDKRLQAMVYSRCSQHAKAARIFEELESFDEAAEAYEADENWAQAGRLWDLANAADRAAEHYYRANQFEDAARCYVKGKNYGLAAETYTRVGDHRAAAECYQQIDLPLTAAKEFLQADDRHAASAALQKIPQQSEDFAEATMLLVPLLVEDGLYEGALHRLQLLPPGDSVGDHALDRLYWEGRVQEALKDFAQAEKCYQKAASLRRDHLDLPQRIAELRQQRQIRESQQQARAPETGELGAADKPPPAQVSFEPGEILVDRYEIQQEIGRGGMSRVYKAEDKVLGEVVAIKILVSRPSDVLRSEERLLREVQICRKITHQNVVRVYDLGRFPGGVFVTMELLEGSSLDKLIDTQERMALSQVKELLAQILRGLREAHGMKVIHRDLKPANVILTTKAVKIMDFGIAHLEDTDTNLTQTGQVIGSPMYMSPEQIQGQPLDARTDLYSFGVLSYALLVGREPFTGKTPTAVALKHLQEPPPRIDRYRSNLSTEWKHFVGKLLEKRPEDRYQSAQEVLEALDQLPE